MKKIILLISILIPIVTCGQSQKISLKNAIIIAQKKSPDYKANLNKNEASYWRNKNYFASFLPQFTLNTTIPSYSKSTRRITNDSGQDVFVNQNQSRIDARLSVTQNVPFTGGSLSINSQISFLQFIKHYFFIN